MALNRPIYALQELPFVCLNTKKETEKKCEVSRDLLSSRVVDVSIFTMEMEVISIKHSWNIVPLPQNL